MFHRNAFRPPGLLILLGAILAVPVWATSVQYSDRVAWEAASSGLTGIDFEGITDTYASYGDASGLTVGDVQFVGVQPASSSYWLYVNNPASGSAEDYGSGALLKGPIYSSSDPSRHILVNLPTGVTSFGVDLMTLDADPATFNILLSTGDQFTGINTAARPNRTFFGLTSDAEISSIQFVLTGGVPSTSIPGIDNFTYGAAGSGGGGGAPEQTPEAATLIMVGMGLILINRLRKKRLPAPLHG